MAEITTNGEFMCILLVLNSFVIVSAKGIECYVCDDCDVLGDCLLQTCPTTPTQPPVVPSTSTTQHSTTKTTQPEPTFVPSIMPSTTTVQSTTMSSSTSVFDTTTPSSSTTIETTDSSEYTEQTKTEVTTDIPSSTVTLEETATEMPLKPKIFNVKTTPAPDYRSVLTKLISMSYHCYSFKVIKDNKHQKKRGCVGVPEDKSACQVLASNFGCSIKNCKVCSEDRCNTAAEIVYSLFPYLFILGFPFLV